MTWTPLARSVVVLPYITMINVIKCVRQWPLGRPLMSAAATEWSQFIAIRSRFATMTFDQSFECKFAHDVQRSFAPELCKGFDVSDLRHYFLLFALTLRRLFVFERSPATDEKAKMQCFNEMRLCCSFYDTCLLYTSPSPRDS